MECLPQDPYFKFNPNVLQDVRKEFNLHEPGAIEEVIKDFEEWIQKQNHFMRKDFSKIYLECSIIMAKGSLEKAKRNLDALCGMRTLLPKFFLKYDAKNELIDLSTFIIPALSPLPTKDNYRVFMAKVVSTDITSEMFSDYYRFFSMLCEYLKVHDYTRGMAIVIDLRHANPLHLAMAINVIDLRSLMSILMEGHGMRLKGIYIVSESKTVEAVVAVFKQVYSEKVAKRIQVFTTAESLYECIPQSLLAEDFGGQQKPMKTLYYEIVELFSTKENVEYFKTMYEYRTNEASRPPTKYNKGLLGIPGSSRLLHVD